MREYVVTGSLAAQYHGIDLGRKPRDIDIIATPKGIDQFQQDFKLTLDQPIKVEGNSSGGITTFPWQFSNSAGDRYIVEIEHVKKNANSSGWYLICSYSGSDPFITRHHLAAMKASHRFLKNSPHFEKTRSDLLTLLQYGHSHEITMENLTSDFFYKLREKETYNYSHPKLNQSKQDFFSDDGVEYVYDHDELHKVVAVYTGQPMYLRYKKEGEEVACSKELWETLSPTDKNYAVYEEAAVLALERSIIPHGTDPKAAYKMALQKICTSITSGWFREYAWWNYDHILDIGNPTLFKHDFDVATATGELIPQSEKAVSSA